MKKMNAQIHLMQGQEFNHAANIPVKTLRMSGVRESVC